ncbi:BlaI/MecI/CopY family transcriptional regulator [Paludisphaera rhizosphaerae]|uniref:BlaI/MecI/CopY family transcriptional regulator n=1 Tax=Paludisphaera rhizosphaerae TaxID=2711216 RepID=UPI0013EC01FB|nr:BlaI/MecI/CopY family transcriptional regulator [Paludisphaera rhizosphaerae]
MARRPSGQPTDAELAILTVLWEHGPAGLGKVHEELQTTRSVALTTVATTLNVMLGKALVKRADGPKGYVWSAAATRSATASGLLGKVVRHVFDGSARGLVAHLIEEGELDERDRQAIRDLLDRADGEKPDEATSRKRKGGRS